MIVLDLIGLKTLISDVPDGFGASVAQRLTVRLLGGVEQDKTVRGHRKERGGGGPESACPGLSRVRVSAVDALGWTRWHASDTYAVRVPMTPVDWAVPYVLGQVLPPVLRCCFRRRCWC